MKILTKKTRIKRHQYNMWYTEYCYCFMGINLGWCDLFLPDNYGYPRRYWTTIDEAKGKVDNYLSGKYTKHQEDIIYYP